MAKYATTNAELQARLVEMTNFSALYPTIASFLTVRYEDFKKQNKYYIESLEEKRNKLFMDNVEMLPKDKWRNPNAPEYQTEEKTGGPVYLSAQNCKDFTNGWDELMKKPITIIL